MTHSQYPTKTARKQGPLGMWGMLASSPRLAPPRRTCAGRLNSAAEVLAALALRRGEGHAASHLGGNMVGLDVAEARLPLVLVVDPVAASRQTLWRLLSRSFGVLEAPDARRAQGWLASRPDIDAMVVQRELPDADGGDFVLGLVSAQASVASRVVLVTRPIDLATVLRSLAGWFFSRDVRKSDLLMRQAARLAS
jgi:CheY-like chemotaxis protein